MFLFNILVLVMLLNHSFFTFILSETPLIAWKQVIAFVFAILIIRKYSYVKINKIKYIYIFIFLFIFSVSGVYIIEDITRTLGYLSSFIGIIYFTYFSLLFTFKSKTELKITYYIVISVCLFISIGIIVDYYTLMFKFMNKLQSGRDMIEKDNYRPCFTLGSPTLLFAVYSIPLLIHFSNNISFRFNRKLLTISIILFCISIFLSGSRLPSILFIIFILYSIIYLKNINIIYKLPVLFIIFLFLYFLFTYFDINRFSTLFLLSDYGNYRRMDLLVNWYNHELLYDFFGLGGGYLSSNSNIFNTGHFESSLLGKYTEYGFVGTSVFFFIYFMILFLKSKESIQRLWIICMFIQSIFSPTLSSLLFLSILGFSYPLVLSIRNELYVHNCYSNSK